MAWSLSLLSLTLSLFSGGGVPNVGEAEKIVNSNVIRNILGKDKQFALTFRLNIESLLRNETLLKQIWLSKSSIETIFKRANLVLEAVPKIDKK